MPFEANIIKDSVSLEGIRLTTFQLRYPKFIHGEFMTHRRFSRNASSSRAIPTAKYLQEVRSDELRAQPIFWGKNQSGMQAAEELADEALLEAKREWKMAALYAASTAECMNIQGVHKQIVNRVMEPFVHINVVCTATEYMNFFGLRLDKAAQPEMRHLAEIMWKRYNNNAPKLLKGGEWHLPYVEDEDWSMYPQDLIVGGDGYSYEEALEALIKVSVARCARVSYKSFETGKMSTHAEDLKLYDRLLGSSPIHASPAEHQATPDFRRDSGSWANPHLHGNFEGWGQYRKTLKGESCAPLPS